MGSFAEITNGRERWSGNHSVARHRHARPYAAVILAGSYEECGTHGRFRVGAGDVLLHGAFDAHLDRFQKAGAHILNLILDSRPAYPLGRVCDPDRIAVLAERDPAEAGIRLTVEMTKKDAPVIDWPDLLANDLLRETDCRLDEWARRHDVSPETLSRGFGKVFGVTPVAFRLEQRARAAFASIQNDGPPLAVVAAQTGFSDQAHMSRAIRTLTGQTPGYWRRSNSFKTDRPRAA